MAGKRIEDVMEAAGGNWGGIEQITPTLRLGYAGEFIIIEKTLDNGDTGVYPVPYIAEADFASFLAWRAGLQK